MNQSDAEGAGVLSRRTNQGYLGEDAGDHLGCLRLHLGGLVDQAHLPPARSNGPVGRRTRGHVLTMDQSESISLSPFRNLSEV
eukprot:5691966-Pyramimonas_sp.AAC.2